MSTSLETTQACSQAPDAKPLGAKANEIARRPIAPGLSATELSPIGFGQSRRLWQGELAIYLALFLCASLALFPFMLIAWYWPCAWLGFSLLVGSRARHCWRREFSSRSLYCTKGRWYLRDIGGEREIMLCGEILLWPQLIVLPMRGADGHKTQLLFTPDAMTADDWRRLRVWLRFWTNN